MFETPTIDANNAESSEVPTEETRLYAALSISEKANLEASDGEKSEAIELGSRRSLENIKKSLNQYLEYRVKSGTSSDLVISELESKVREVKGNLVMSYYETIADAEKIIKDGALKNLFEFSGAEQDERKKGGDIGIETALHKRRVIDEALGWKRPETVYHLAVEEIQEGHHPDGPASNYGSVRFVFDYEALAKNSTFTEGDSLNANHLPEAISAKRNGSEPTRNVEGRQISQEHVPIAKTILSLATESENRPAKQAIFLRYIEAQVGNISGAEIFKNIKAIEVDIVGAFKEARSARILFDQEKEEEIYERYFHRKIGAPRVLSFDDDSPPVDMEAYRAEVYKLHMAKFTEALDEIERFCESSGVEYRQRGDMGMVEDLCHQLG